MMKIDTGSNIKIRHTDGDNILSINPELVLLGNGFFPMDDKPFNPGSWKRQDDGWEYDLSVHFCKFFDSIEMISDVFKLRLHVEYVNTNNLSKCGYKQIKDGNTKAWFFGSPHLYDRERTEKVLNELKGTIHMPFEIAIPSMIQLSDNDLKALKEHPSTLEFIVVEQNGTPLLIKRYFPGVAACLEAFRTISWLYGTDCHVWHYAPHHFRYYQIRNGKDTFKVGMKRNSEIDMIEFDFGRKRVEERFKKLRCDSDVRCDH